MKRTLLFLFLVIGLSVHAQLDSTAIKDSLFFVSLQHWNYETDTNEMTSEVYHVARVYANKKLELDFPYKSVYADMYVRNMEGQNSVWFEISRGFIGELGDDSVNVLMRFDNEQPKQYTFYFGRDRKKTFAHLDINSTHEVIEKLKKSKILKMEMDFWHRNNRILEFNVEGLKWAYKDKNTPERNTYTWN